MRQMMFDRQWSSVDLAYFAGLFDGEGTILIQRAQPKYANHRSVEHQLRISIGMTSYEIILWIQQTFGGRLSCERHKLGRKPCWRWIPAQREAVKIFKAVLPFLKLKRPQAELALKFQEHMSSRKRRPRYSNVSHEDLELRESFLMSIRALNHRGEEHGVEVPLASKN